jgi:DNA-binding HxlR family transcriptional regulator
MVDTIPPVGELATEGSSCPRLDAKLMHALGLLQEKWTLFIVSALLQGPRGFNEMGRNAGRVNSTTLAQRLAHLEQAGLLRKTIHSTMPPRTSYELTESGRALQPVVEAIAAWADRYMPDQPTGCGEAS